MSFIGIDHEFVVLSMRAIPWAVSSVMQVSLFQVRVWLEDRSRVCPLVIEHSFGISRSTGITSAGSRSTTVRRDDA